MSRITSALRQRTTTDWFTAATRTSPRWGCAQVSTLAATAVSTNSATLNGTRQPERLAHHRLVPVGRHHQLRQPHLGDRPGQRDHRLASLRPTGRVNPRCHLSLPHCGNERLRTGLRQRPELHRGHVADRIHLHDQQRHHHHHGIHRCRRRGDHPRHPQWLAGHQHRKQCFRLLLQSERCGHSR